MPSLNVRGTRLHYDDAGRGPALLLLHGWGTSGRVWQSCLPDLVRDHRVVTFDWRGCGRSDQPAEGNTIDGVTADVAAVIEALELEKAVVVGSSFGAVFGTELALARPELVGGVVAVDGPAYWPAAAMLEKVLDLRERMLDDRIGTLAEWVPYWFAPGVSPQLVDWTVRQLADSSVYLDDMFTEVTRYDPRPRLPRLSVPITYLHGELDTEIPLEVPRACAALTPGARVHVIAGCGHIPHQENPRAFTAALRAVVPVAA
ncbi:alpha/beta fold hydrolase [Amycolatopsis sp. cmx-8-4]|uniref:alpha/beta fold hydrolase n=1 Tax=Amycolatopsis sp. cmx-8-4 TaxID=2790947 RepID=UPI0039796E22